MKSRFVILILSLLCLSSSIFAQFTKLHDFGNGVDGNDPRGSLISVGNYLYGLTKNGGTGNYGTIFKIKPDGSAYSKLFEFADSANGIYPVESLVSDGTYLYGTAANGGTGKLGVVFKISTDGTGYNKLLEFSGTNGNGPISSLIYDGTYLYGTTSAGGTPDYGTVFKVKPDGSGFVKLHEFDGNNGWNPYWPLLMANDTLYGTTAGQSGSYGNIFRINPDGTGYVSLQNFNGKIPRNALISIGNFLYGTFQYDGNSTGNGSIFKIKHDGTGFNTIHQFAGSTDGSQPWCALYYDSPSNYLYGTTAAGGINNNGTIFKIKPDGTGYGKIYDFSNYLNGFGPLGSFISDGTFLYGTASWGGNYDYFTSQYPGGVVFKYNPTCTADTVKQTISICAGDTLKVGTNIHTTSGTYTDILKATSTCDSVVITNLTVISKWLNCGLLAYYPFTGNAGDSSGNGNNGTVTGAVLITDRFGKTGRAYYFYSTVDDHIQIPANVTNGLSLFTISLWVRTTQSASGANFYQDPTLFGIQQNGTPSNDFGITLHNGVTGIWSGLSSGASTASYGISVNDNNWHNIVVVNNGTTIMQYVDGKPEGTSIPSGGKLANIPFYIGSGHSTSGNPPAYFGGSIDEVRIYSRPLKINEIGDLYCPDPVKPNLGKDSLNIPSNYLYAFPVLSVASNATRKWSYAANSPYTDGTLPTTQNSGALFSGVAQHTYYIVCTDSTNCGKIAADTIVLSFSNNPAGTVVSTAGNLASILSGKLNSITSITVTGTIDARDFRIMRDSMPNLTSVDLSGATIVAYTGIWGTNWFYWNLTETDTYAANTIPIYAYGGIEYIQGETENPARFTSIKIPSTTTTIANFAFSYCTGLTSFTIPPSVTTLVGDCFDNCTGLTSFNIPSSLSTLSIGFLSGCSGLTFINIPSSILTISNDAFNNCSGLKLVNIPSSVQYINALSFGNCNNLSSVTIPSSVTSIVNQAFSNDTSLRSVTVNWQVPISLTNTYTANYGVFYNVDTNKCVLYVPYGTKSAYQAAPQWKSFNNIVELPKISSITKIIAAPNGSSAQDTITTDKKWIAISNQSWLTVSPGDSISGSSIITFTATGNSGSQTRTAIVTISGKGFSSTINITQTQLINLSNGLVLWYPDATGTDATSNHNNATLVNITPTTNEFGNTNKAFSFPGIYNPGRLSVGAPASLNFDTAFSFSTWVKIDNMTGLNGYGGISNPGQQVLFAKSADYSGVTIGYNQGYGFYFNLNGWSNINVVTNITNYTSGVESNQWTYVTVTSTNTDAKIYVNKQLVQEITGTIPLSKMNNLGLSFGQFYDGYWYPLWGEMSDIRLYNRTLNNNEINDLYNGTLTPDSLLLPLDGTTGIGSQTTLQWKPVNAANPYIVNYKNNINTYTDTVSSGNSLVISGLIPNTTYLWNVTENISGYNVTSDYFTFTTGDYPYINITLPKPSDYFDTLSTMDIAIDTNMVHVFNFYYSLDNGNSWNYIKTDSNKINYTWIIPNTINGVYLNSLIKVTNTDGSLQTISSPFTLANQPQIAITAPTKGSAFPSIQNIGVTFFNKGFSTIYGGSLYFSSDGGKTFGEGTFIYQNMISQSNYYTYALPTDSSQNCLLKFVYYVGDQQQVAYSDSLFSVLPLPGCITIDSPQNGQDNISKNFTFNWTLDPHATSYELDFYGNDESHLQYFSKSDSFQVNNLQPNIEYNLYINGQNAAGSGQQCNSTYFSTASYPFITISYWAPYNNPLNPGDEIYFEWSTFNMSSSAVNIYYSADSGKTWTSINKNYEWSLFFLGISNQFEVRQ